MRFFVVFCLLNISINLSSGQDANWQLLFSIAVEDMDKISMDNRGNIFYSDSRGNVFKSDASGKVVNQYSPKFQAKLDQLEAFSTTNLFLFSADLQEATLLDSHLAPINTFSFQQEDIGIVKAATLGNNNTFWLFDEVDFSLKKFDYQRNEVVQRQPLNIILGQEKIEVSEIQERQNLVFVNIKNIGVFIFDNQGSFISKYDVALEQKMAIYNDHLFYIKDNNVHKVNFFSGNEKIFEKPDLASSKIAVGSYRMVFYSGTSAFVYRHQGFD